ncbi:MAG: RICIN domain-containing protein [Nitrospirales bacterium]|nr:RICIN domain-containing protein [Nitrospirales bacterium]
MNLTKINKKHSILISLALMTMILFTTKCFAQIETVRQPLGVGYKVDECTLAETKVIHDAFGHLLDVISNFTAFQTCLANAPLIEFSGLRNQVTFTASEGLRKKVLTNVRCYDAPQDVLAEARVNIKGESMLVDRGFLSSGSVRDIAATMAHEIMHNRGYRHKENDFGSQYYSNTVPEQVEACVRTGSPNPSAGTEAVKASSSSFPLGGNAFQHVPTSKCWHPKGGSPLPSNNTYVVLYDGCNEDRLMFRLLADGSIRHSTSGKCLHPKGGSTHPGNNTPLVLYDGCVSDPGGGKRLKFRRLHDGSIQHVHSGKCVHPKGGSTHPGNNTPLVLYDGCVSDPGGGERLKFSLAP